MNVGHELEIRTREGTKECDFMGQMRMVNGEGSKKLGKEREKKGMSPKGTKRQVNGPGVELRTRRTRNHAQKGEQWNVTQRDK